jgi:hypothetical protein
MRCATFITRSSTQSSCCSSSRGLWRSRLSNATSRSALNAIRARSASSQRRTLRHWVSIRKQNYKRMKLVEGWQAASTYDSKLVITPIQFANDLNADWCTCIHGMLDDNPRMHLAFYRIAPEKHKLSGPIKKWKRRHRGNNEYPLVTRRNPASTASCNVRSVIFRCGGTPYILTRKRYRRRTCATSYAMNSLY